jgi:hypothetical protein
MRYIENERCKAQTVTPPCHHYFDIWNLKLSNHNVGCKTRKQHFIAAWGNAWFNANGNIALNSSGIFAILVFFFHCMIIKMYILFKNAFNLSTMGKILLVLATLFWIVILLTRHERENDRCILQNAKLRPESSLLWHVKLSCPITTLVTKLRNNFLSRFIVRGR